MKLKYFLKEVLSKFGKNKEFKIHQTSTGRIKANLQLLRITARKLKSHSEKKIKGKRRRSGTSEQGTEFAIVLLSAFVTLRISDNTCMKKF